MKVMIADDQEIVREGLKMILSLYEKEEVSVIGEAPNGRVLLEQLEEMNPDVILMDIRMPEMDGITAAQLVKERHPQTKIIILTTFDEDEYIIQGLKNGVEGYILKDSSSGDLLNAIKTVYAGSVLLNPKVTERMVEAISSSGLDNSISSRHEEQDKLGLLTPREMEVARHILSGSSNKEIAQALFVTEGTVKNYVSRILDKLECRNRTELGLYLSRLGRF
ncbi:response regulator transcription factor [Paenibacillus melissococcoides]|uniref:Response regulator transcription factor n=1 Tax=Paenibacillus melissococcoides TaxID=2912268 RepID=A0ABM9FYB8_9BACL|nr:MULTISPECIES: response regulator transcription factor [Paenibacillus]MEB9893667.1 response regulator transcription factor [Bacillus cereus]CAH8244187.1 response regulator transcription factor [Paenibacillus melissococcoides]CAH8703695.1 response regulator transcription factor [Paenibacillus melissococcoides]CAH8706197.1 response regulator transcription factor [Paenibacillus melissococcoides]